MTNAFIATDELHFSPDRFSGSIDSAHGVETELELRLLPVLEPVLERVAVIDL